MADYEIPENELAKRFAEAWSREVDESLSGFVIPGETLTADTLRALRNAMIHCRNCGAVLPIGVDRECISCGVWS